MPIFGGREEFSGKEKKKPKRKKKAPLLFLKKGGGREAIKTPKGETAKKMRGKSHEPAVHLK